MATKQTNIVANPDRGLVFFEGEELCYNYQTGQWSSVSAYDGYGMYSISDHDSDIGLVVYSAGSVDLQTQLKSHVAQTACIATGANELNPGGRAFVSAIKPLVNGGTLSVQAGYKSAVTDSITWTDAASVNSRTGAANFRAEGRYLAARVEVSGGFNTILGAEVEFTPSGTV